MSTDTDDESLLPDGQQLADVLGEFASTMLTDFPIQGILDHLVERIVSVLPISSAGVTLISPGVDPRYIAASDESALRYEKLQTDLDEGPCLLAYHSGEPVAVPDLRAEERFPTFGPQALGAGLGAVFTFPLRHGERRLGALDLYRDEPGALSPRAMAAAQTLADVVTAYLLNAQAREDLQDSSDRSREAALHDPLTGLPNRVLMLERLEHAFLRSTRTGKATGVLFIDLDEFKKINDAHGHRVGDELLAAVAARLTGQLRPADTLARLSGDEFVAVCEDLDSPVQAAAIAARLDTALNRPFALSEAAVVLTASIGITYTASADGADQNPNQVLHEADMAMYKAKRDGGNRQIFPNRQRHLPGLEDDIPHALPRGQLHVEYQPIVNTPDQRIVGFEALLRWSHPTRGTVPPAVFIPMAEKSGLINQIGQWVLEQAWSARHLWQDRFPGDGLEMSVNVSAHQLMSPGFTSVVAAVLATTDDQPELLTLEITESVFIQDGERALVVLNDLKELGVKLALDDFGTGYSSLSYLRRFPVDVIKIDRTFIADLKHDPTSHTIVGAVVQLAHGLGMTVIAEGVETDEQLEEIAALGCDHCQGFYFARPTAVEQIATILDSPAGHTLPLAGTVPPQRTGLTTTNEPQIQT